MKTRKNFGSKNRTLRLEALEQRTLLSAVLFQDDFSTDQGWTYDTNWERGYATSCPPPTYGYGDPGEDHTTTDDNYLIGTVIGGYIGGSEPVHDYYYATSPVIDCGGGQEIKLSFYRYSSFTTFGHKVFNIMVRDGESWVQIWKADNSQGPNDNSWKYCEHDVSAYADFNSNFRVRFGYKVTSSPGETLCGWNIDDVKVFSMAGSTTPWDRISIGGGSTHRHLMDIDNDGFVDSLSRTRWYKNPGDGTGSWTSYSIGNTAYPGAGCRKIGDVNGDGLPDLVIGVGRNYPSPDRNQVYAFINPGDTGTWDRYLIGVLPESADGVETVGIGDMNKDGHPDILAGGEGKELRWYVNPGYMTDNWGSYLLYGSGSKDVEGMVIKDFNNDGWLDVAATFCHPYGFVGETSVFINPQEDVGNWTRIVLSTAHYSCVESISAGDFDGDGWVDVVLAPYAGGQKLYWYKNPQEAGAWTEYTIDGSGYTYPEVADIDLDGKDDIIWYNGTKTYWYKKEGEDWIRNVVHSGNIVGTNCAVGDVDNDGDPDIIKDGYWYVNPTNSPQLGYWKLDEGTGTVAGDSSSVGNDGEVFNADWVDGKIGKALEFDGTNDYVAIDDFVYNQAGQVDKITVMAWINTTDTHNAIIDWDRSEYWSLGVDFAGTAGSGKISWNTCGETEGIHDFGSAITVNDGNWRHIAATYDSATGRKEIYIDGELDNSVDDAYSDGQKLGTGVTRYGFIGDGSEATTFNGARNSRLFDGTIDEARVLRQVLSAEEIKNQYEQVVGLWHFNEGEGALAEDSSDFENDGTIYGATWTTGKVGYGLDFDGVDDCVDMGDVLDVGEDVTIEFWMKLDNLDTRAALVTKGDRAGIGTWGSECTTDGALIFGVRNYNLTDPYFRAAYTSNDVISPGAFYHVAFVYDDSEISKGSIYLNGVLQSLSHELKVSLVRGTALPLRIGIYSNGNHPFTGAIDEVGIYSRVLSEDEIYQHYLEGDPTKVESVVVNDGESQRSMVTSATVTFSRIVTLDPGAFEIIQRGGGGAVIVGVAENVVGDKTVATLTFSGGLTGNGSLVDGNYQLTILDDKVHGGLAGGDYLLGDEATDAFFRLYGDSDGNRYVDMLDFFRFRGTMNKASGDPDYLSYFDRDGDGYVDMLDFWHFRSGFGDQMLFA